VAETVHLEARPQYVRVVLGEVPRTVDAASGELESYIRGIWRCQEQTATYPENPLELAQSWVNIMWEQMLEKLPCCNDIHCLIIEGDIRGEAAHPPRIDVGQQIKALLNHIDSPQLSVGMCLGKHHPSASRATANIKDSANVGREVTRELPVPLYGEDIMLSLRLKEVLLRIAVKIKNARHVEGSRFHGKNR
jgi:hypothetical protein